MNEMMIAFLKWFNAVLLNIENWIDGVREPEITIVKPKQPKKQASKKLGRPKGSKNKKK